MSIDSRRHRSLFDPDAWGDTPVAVVGCGGSGSSLAWMLARLGVTNLYLFDGDEVAAHNLANQQFAQADIGRNKAVVLAEAIRCALGNQVHAIPEFVSGTRVLAPVVFLCVDTMTARKDIMESCLFGNEDVSQVFDGRMDASHAVLYAIDPNNAQHRELWNHYWFPDEAAENEGHACGGKISVVYAANITAALMAHEFVRWNASRQEFSASAPANQRWLDLNKDSMRVVRW